MLIAILATTIIFMGIIILLICIGYNQQLRAVRMWANVNAGLWAEAEVKAHEAEIQVAKLDAALKAKISTYEHMRHLAKEAIKAAGEANNIDTDQRAVKEWFVNGCPNCGESFHYVGDTCDSILNASEIDN